MSDPQPARPTAPDDPGTGDQGPGVIDGFPLSPGLATGRAYLYRDIYHRTVSYDIKPEDLPVEWQRLEKALAEVREDLEASAERTGHELDPEAAAIFTTHASLLTDEHLHRDLRETMERYRINAEQVVREVLHAWAKRLRPTGHEDDLTDLIRRLLRRLHGITAHQLEDLPVDSVVVARRLLPSDTLYLDPAAVAAVVLEEGGWASHAAMLTRERGIPAVGGVDAATERMVPDDLLAIDGLSGRVLRNPARSELAAFERRSRQVEATQAEAWQHRQEPAVDRAGRTIAVWANIVSADEARAAIDAGAEGIGLVRSERIYLTRDHLPDADELAACYRELLEPITGRPVVLRLLDAGADKLPLGMPLSDGANGPLGLRGVRLLLRYPQLLDTQLRACLQLRSNLHDLRLLVPMVTFPNEMATVRARLTAMAAEIGVEPPPLGAMIETPAAALDVTAIAAEADFLSIGTNDLTQYTMAADRGSVEMRDFFQGLHPAVLELIGRVIERVGSERVALCGELAADPAAVPRLLALGLRNFSVAPPAVPTVKATIRDAAGPGASR